MPAKFIVGGAWIAPIQAPMATRNPNYTPVSSSEGGAASPSPTPNAPQVKRHTALRVLVLGIVGLSAVFVAYVVNKPGALKRIAAGLGYTSLKCSGWEPQTYDVRSVASATPAGQLSWTGDDEFWSLFPCNRSSYSILLAKQNASSECDATIVTAWFDLGRSSWSSFKRSTESYLGNMRLVMSLKNPMVIFTTPDFSEAILDMRRQAGLLDRTTLVALSSLTCSPVAPYHKPVQSIMCSDKLHYNDDTSQPDTPERTQPWYNLLMYAKAYFVKAASVMPQTSSGYYIWMDAGCHEPMCSGFMQGTCFLPKPYARKDRIRIAQTARMTVEQWRMDPVEYYKRSYVHFAGTIWGVGRATVGAAFDLFSDSMKFMISLGAVDQDQAVFAAMYKKAPELFDSFFVNNEWKDIGRDF